MGKIIVALDAATGWHAAASLVDSLCGHVEGFKIGLPLALSLGVEAARRLRSLCQGALWVADFKLADIGPVMVKTVEHIVDAVDAVIAHGFVGRRGALDELKNYLDARDKKLVIVVSMSHPGALEVYEPALPNVLRVVEETRPWGVVAPATRPQVVRLVREKLPWAKILSPGVGAQGAAPGAALCSGADYEIIGRAITAASNPVEAATRLAEEQERALRSCRTSK